VSHRIRVGVVGLGRRWPGYRAALHDLRQRVAVRAVFDPSPPRAEQTARDLSCAAAGGVVDLVERDDVDAVLLLGGAWYGLWPLEQACRAHKHALFAGSLLHDDAHADALREQVRMAGTPVMPVLVPALAPAVRPLMCSRPEIGPPRLARIDWDGPGRARPERPFAGAAVLPALLYLCGRLFPTAPPQVGLRAVAPGQGDTAIVSVFVDFGAGRAAQVNLSAGWGARPSCRVRAVADHGTATAVLPRVHRIRTAVGVQAIRVPPESAARAALRAFLDAVAARQPPQPDFEDAYRGLAWTRAALRSLAAGGSVVVTPSAL
jgi:predicted dehydrogenase